MGKKKAPKIPEHVIRYVEETKGKLRQWFLVQAATGKRKGPFRSRPAAHAAKSAWEKEIRERLKKIQKKSYMR